MEDAQARNQAMRDYGLLSPNPGQAFDRITRLVAAIYGVSQAYIALVDDRFQWFQNSEGLSDAIISREKSFCGEIVRLDGPLIVPDAPRDPRFVDHPNVMGAPFIRFYAGVPLRADDGMVLGALCILSVEPRPMMTAEEISRLEDFAEIIMAEVNLRRTARQRDEARVTLERAIDFSDMLVWQIQPDLDKVTVSGAAAEFWGADSADELGSVTTLTNRIHPDDRAAVQAELEKASANKTALEVEFRIDHPRRGIRWIAAKGDWDARDDGWVLTGVNVDVTEQKNRQEHANLLMRELHHRMRNLFATVGAIISLTRQSAESIDDYFERISHRLDALNRAQNVLLSANFMTGSMHALMCEVEAGFPRVRWSGPDLLLPENALVSMALLLNELATNAVKHGALMSDKGAVEVHWWHEENAEGAREFHLRWSESGAPHDVGPPEKTRFGTLLMERSVRNNLGGRIERRWEAQGLICDIIMPARWRET